MPPSELQRLIDAAQPGATVTVPKGTHTVPVQITKSLTLKGSSPADCLLEVTANGSALFIDAGGKGDVSMEGLTIKWQLAGGIKGVERPVALAVKDTNASIRNCRFVPLGNTQQAPMAIRIEGRSKATVSDCRFEGFDFVINYGPGTEGLVEECLLRDGGHQGVTGYDRSTLRVERTMVAGFKYHGLRCTGGTLHVKDCLLMNNKVSGIYLGNKDGQGTISNTLMIHNSEAVAAFYQAQFQIHNNLILDSTSAGIGMWDTCRLQIADNIFHGNAKALVAYPKGGKDCYAIGANAFWQNTADTENCRRADDSILADPLFQDPSAGDYSIKSGPTLRPSASSWSDGKPRPSPPSTLDADQPVGCVPRTDLYRRGMVRDTHPTASACAAHSMEVPHAPRSTFHADERFQAGDFPGQEKGTFYFFLLAPSYRAAPR